MSNRSSSIKMYTAIGAVISWLALLLQLYLIIQNRTASVTETVIRYCSYFTILSNILVAICFTAVCLKGITANYSFFTKPKTLTAVTVYITIVGLVYNTVLRFLWTMQGWDKVANELLHVIIPILFIVFWVKFVPKQDHQWKNMLPWMIFPLLYLGYSLLRGPFAQWYPYPFLNVTTLGYGKVLVNSAGVTLAFVLVAALYIAIARRTSKN